VQLEQLAHEPRDQRQVLGPVRQALGSLLGLVEAGEEVGDVLPQPSFASRFGSM
jgi:hypothetical protein